MLLRRTFGDMKASEASRVVESKKLTRVQLEINMIMDLQGIQCLSWSDHAHMP